MSDIVFKTFQEEKAFRKDNLPDELPWGKIPILSGSELTDSDLILFLHQINQLPFAYTKGESCSGSFLDHKNSYVSNVDSKYGLDSTYPQGYCILRVDVLDSNFKTLRDILLKPEGSTLNDLGYATDTPSLYTDMDLFAQHKRGVHTFAYQVPALNEVLDPTHPEHEYYLTKVWKDLTNQILDF